MLSIQSPVQSAPLRSTQLEHLHHQLVLTFSPKGRATMLINKDLRSLPSPTTSALLGSFANNMPPRHTSILARAERIMIWKPRLYVKTASRERTALVVQVSRSVEFTRYTRRSHTGLWFALQVSTALPVIQQFQPLLHQSRVLKELTEVQ